MTITKLRLFGTSESYQRARLLIENLPQIKRIDDDSRIITLFSQEKLTEKTLIPLLLKSGISGYCLNN